MGGGENTQSARSRGLSSTRVRKEVSFSKVIDRPFEHAGEEGGEERESERSERYIVHEHKGDKG